MKIVSIALILFIFVDVAVAQYILKSYCIDDGGVAYATSSGYKMGCSVSQSFIAYLTSSNYIAYIGYWHPPYAPPGWGIEETENASGLKPPIVFSLNQNCPNPVVSHTTIKYSIANPCKVELKLFDVTGRKLTTLVNENQKPGHYQVHWDIHSLSEKQLPNGVYFYRLTAGDYTNAKKMVVVR